MQTTFETYNDPGVTGAAIMAAHRRLSNSSNASTAMLFAVTDRQIDQFVYELYGLSDEEIKIVEGEAKT